MHSIWTISVKRFRYVWPESDETLTLLDGRHLSLTSEDLVIADQSAASGVGGGYGRCGFWSSGQYPPSFSGKRFFFSNSTELDRSPSWFAK